MRDGFFHQGKLRHQRVQPGNVPRAAAGQLIEVAGALGDGELDALARIPTRGEELGPAPPVQAREDAAEQLRVLRAAAGRGGRGGPDSRVRQQAGRGHTRRRRARRLRVLLDIAVHRLRVLQ